MDNAAIALCYVWAYSVFVAGHIAMMRQNKDVQEQILNKLTSLYPDKDCSGQAAEQANQ